MITIISIFFIHKNYTRNPSAAAHVITKSSKLVARAEKATCVRYGILTSNLALWMEEKVFPRFYYYFFLSAPHTASSPLFSFQAFISSSLSWPTTTIYICVYIIYTRFTTTTNHETRSNLLFQRAQLKINEIDDEQFFFHCHYFHSQLPDGGEGILRS